MPRPTRTNQLLAALVAAVAIALGMSDYWPALFGLVGVGLLAMRHNRAVVSDADAQDMAIDEYNARARIVRDASTVYEESW